MRKLWFKDWIFVAICTIPTLDIWFAEGALMRQIVAFAAAISWVEGLLGAWPARLLLGLVWLIVPYAFYKSYRRRRREDMTDVDFG
jgi:uncharacterized membrane protein